MGKKDLKEMSKMIKDATEAIPISSTWSHYKNRDRHYRIIDIVVNEADSLPLVIYEGLYEEVRGVKFARPLESFLEKVEVNGVEVSRFEMVG